jgi:hypothetical protein
MPLSPDQTVARVRIGRVVMKAGGASVIPLPPRGPKGHTVQLARAWIEDVMAEERAPDAICAVAVWLRPEHPAYPLFAVRYASATPAILTATLPDVMAGYVRNYIAGMEIEDSIMSKLGYVADDEPDPAA